MFISAEERQAILEAAQVEATGNAAVDLILGSRLVGMDPKFEPMVLRLFGLFGPRTLMGRLVVGHGDVHEMNILRRNPQTSELVLIDFDRVMRMPAACDLGVLIQLVGVEGPLPPLEHRQEMARSYLEAIGAEEAAQWERQGVDDILFDMEIGRLLRECFLAAFLAPIPACGEFSKNAVTVIEIELGMLEAAQSDAELREKILVHGLSEVRRASPPQLLQD